MPGDAVHVAWGESRAESVRDALRAQGCAEPVIALPGALGVGPIDPADPDGRRAWARDHLRADPEEPWDEPEAPWAAAVAPGRHPVHWVCLTDAGEHACFLAFAARMAGRPFDVVDATGVEPGVPGAVSPVRSLGQMRPEDIVAAGLLARRRPVAPAEARAAAGDWARLRRENAPLRVVRDGRLVSAPLTHFDAVLIGEAAPEPVVAARLIRLVLDRLAADPGQPGRGAPYEFLFARILALGATGALEVAGPGPGLRDYTARRPGGPARGASPRDPLTASRSSPGP